MTARVAIFGGGVAGLTAAHELMERGFEVVLFEARDVPGGKARSIPVPGTGEGGRRDLPGEHGFRFFPCFYRHLPDTMRRIPYGRNPEGVLGNLVPAERVHGVCSERQRILLPAHAPSTAAELAQWARFIARNEIGVPLPERLLFVKKLLVLLTSCEGRRFGELENVDWWTFLGADRASLDFQRLLAGSSRLLVAARPRESSARSYGQLLTQTLSGMLLPGARADRVLCGPTSDVWLEPWRDHLLRGGVDVRHGERVSAIHGAGGRITGAEIERANGAREVIQADHYIAALPIEAMRPLVTDAMREADPGLSRLDRVRTAWMNGLQLYFDRRLPFPHGHTAYFDSPWALISIAQAQFWDEVDLSRFGDGSVRDVLSIVISEWGAPGILYGKPAARCSRLEIRAEVIAQIRAHLRGKDLAALDRARLVTWFLDPAIVHAAPDRAINLEPLVINTPGSWADRPDAVTAIENFFIASDYVRTHTDVPSMEAANEAARRAVNGVLAATGSSAAPCDIFPMRLPPALGPLIRLDEGRFRAARPHVLEVYGA
jgi:uncharacterized protein with NAD-binding domain and iron-sulfur cluster